MKKHIKKETKRLWLSKEASLKANAPRAGYKKEKGRKKKRKSGECTDYFPRRKVWQKNRADTSSEVPALPNVSV